MSAVSVASTAAAASTSVQLELYGSVQPTCAFTQTPTQQNLTTLQQGAVVTMGTLAFRCNLADSPSVHLTVQSDNGALKRDGGAETVAYSAEWDIPGGGNMVDAASFQAAQPFTVAAGDIVGGQGGAFKVQVTGATASLAAGTYRDRITYTISP